MGLDKIIGSLQGLKSGLMGAPAGRLFFEEAPKPGSGLVIQWSIGPDAGRVDLADALLVDATSPGQLRKIVGFCARKKLPVEVWLLSGVWCLPTNVDAVARWVIDLSERAGPASVWVDPFAMPKGYRRKLGAHLRRAGAPLGPKN